MYYSETHVVAKHFNIAEKYNKSQFKSKKILRQTIKDTFKHGQKFEQANGRTRYFKQFEYITGYDQFGHDLYSVCVIMEGSELVTAFPCL